ncbi:ESX secretion-associated protein EspG [Actinokineospora sp. PR83]|uniref:ESX secretion-associated protein EspG n=1 Tax=Actinokineospora sp. PR83 TaxID=2884908 RepID=UPI001F1BB719|nr:ESX secretion-associated protein EspG [Actinokineospora sp. PR83]MCG8920522.1 ESX secretion-associated protein EspG [Actinokineospora sp. PR83]
MPRIECSLAELDALGSALDLPVWRFPFTAPVFGGLGRAELFAAVNAGLSSRGLIHRGRFDPDLEAVLRLHATGRVSIAVNGMAGGAQVTALAVLNGTRGVLAVLRDGRIAFRPLPAERVARAVVDTVPPLPAGPGNSVTVSDSPAPAAVQQSPTTVLRRSDRAGDRAGRDFHAARRILARPRRGGGAFLISTRGRPAQPDPSEAISWVDTDVGRYAVTTAAGQEAACT